MNKRLEKRHKRKVARERQQKTTTEADLRTPEQIQAARTATRATWGGGTKASGNAPAFLSGHTPGVSSASRTDA